MKTRNHGRCINVDDKITIHLKNPKNKILFEILAKQNNMTISEYGSKIIEEEVLKNIKIEKENKENEVIKQYIVECEDGKKIKRTEISTKGSKENE